MLPSFPAKGVGVDCIKVISGTSRRVRQVHSSIAEKADCGASIEAEQIDHKAQMLWSLHCYFTNERIGKEQNMIKASRHRLAEFWCRLMHPAPMWPFHGRYRCRTCRRDYPVPWQSDLRKTSSPQKTERLRAASFPVLLRMAVSKLTPRGSAEMEI